MSNVVKEFRKNNIATIDFAIIYITDYNDIPKNQVVIFLTYFTFINYFLVDQLKVFATILLASSIFIQTFSSFIVKIDFYMNQSYIAKNLCVNREKPMMHCNGKCYLSKKLKQQEKQDPQAPVPKYERFDVVLYFAPSYNAPQNSLSKVKNKFFIKDENLVSSFPSSIFHPPSA